MIRVTLTVDLDEDIWGAEQCFADGGEESVKQLCWEDIIYLLEEAQWKIEQIK